MLSFLLETAAAITGRAANKQVQREKMLPQLSQGKEEAMEKAEVVLLSSQPAWGPRCQGGSVRRLQTIAPTWLSVYTETTGTRYAASSEMQHFVELQLVQGQFLQESFGDSSLPGHFGPHAKLDTNSRVSDPHAWGRGFIMGKGILN